MRREHRGHRLGLAVKVANLRQATAARPDLTRCETSNGESNQWMVAINEALGFRLVAEQLQLKKDLSGR